MNLPASEDEEIYMNEGTFRIPQRRRSSRFNRWILDQQVLPTAESDDIAAISDAVPFTKARNNAYLAYPELNRTIHVPDDSVTDHSYDFIDDDIPESPVHNDKPELTTPNARPSRLLHAPSSLRNFHISFRSNSPAASMSVTSSTPSRSPSHVSIFPRLASRGSFIGKNTPRGHNYSSSLSTLGFSNQPDHSISNLSKWCPSVLGRFSSVASLDTSHALSPDASSRPSISSINTYSTTAVTPEMELPSVPQKLSFIDSIRSVGRSTFASGPATISSLSLWSQPGTSTSHTLHSQSNDASGSKASSEKDATTRVPFGLKYTPSNTSHTGKTNDAAVHTYNPSLPYVAYSSTSNRGTLSRVSLPHIGNQSRNRKKRILVMTGIDINDIRKFDGAKRWCEGFGEVNQIIRMPNGDLHVQYCKSEVADTVCRLKAKVYMPGVGSVYLSWCTANKG